MNRSKPPTRRTPLHRTTPLERAGTASEPRSVDRCSDETPAKGSKNSHGRARSLQRNNSFAASPAQRSKVRDLPCLKCGKGRHEAKIDPHHLIASCCDHPDAVVPCCRTCHRAHHDGSSLLEYLWPRFTVELQHALTHVSPVTLIQTVSKDHVEWRSLNGLSPTTKGVTQ